MTNDEDAVRKIIEKSKAMNRQEQPKEEGMKISKEDYNVLVSLAKEKNVLQPAQPAQSAQPVVPEDYDEPELLDEKEFIVQGEGVDVDVDYSDIMSRPTILYYDTDRTCSIINAKIKKDGSVRVGGRVFDFTEGQPAILNTGGRKGKKTHPFYVIKYDNMKPIDVVVYPKSNPTPEETNRLVNLKTLETLSSIAGRKIGKLPLIILILVGFAIGFVTKLMLSMLSIW